MSEHAHYGPSQHAHYVITWGGDVPRQAYITNLDAHRRDWRDLMGLVSSFIP